MTPVGYTLGPASSADYPRHMPGIGGGYCIVIVEHVALGAPAGASTDELRTPGKGSEKCERPELPTGVQLCGIVKRDALATGSPIVGMESFL
jgi:hypothetical protein